ncbi:MAG: hypothetical protein M1830_008202 [Pleopsidium flavum]|nr:MAG: hypothetical protein M1830_008202 [Pleopsidium flavum]
MAEMEELSIVKTEENGTKDVIFQQTSFNGKLSQFTYPSSRTTSPTKRLTRSATLLQSTPPAPSPKRKRSDLPTPSPSPHNNNNNNTPKKPKRSSSKYAPLTTYAHLPNLLTDAIAPSLILLFIGVNPGLATARTGHAYAHPSNLFWKLLHSSGCTDRRCLPSEDHDLPHLYGLGNTNIVQRATKDAGQLSKGEMDAGVEALEAKVRSWRPEAVCVVGKGIWESVWRVRHGRGIGKAEFRYGWQDEGENMGVGSEGDEGGQEGWKGARVFVATSTSGLAAGMKPAEKEAVWKPLGEWVCRRRVERGWNVEEKEKEKEKDTEG